MEHITIESCISIPTLNNTMLKLNENWPRDEVVSYRIVYPRLRVRFPSRSPKIGSLQQQTAIENQRVVGANPTSPTTDT